MKFGIEHDEIYLFNQYLMKLSKLPKQLFILEDTPHPVIIVGVNEILS